MADKGKGSKRRFTIDDLFTDGRPQAQGVTDLANAKEIRLDRVVADPAQPRRTFDQEKLEELAASIRQEGLLQPIAVRFDAEQDVYIIIHGERRWRASRLAGKETVAAIVRDVPAERLLIQQLMENIVRDDLNAIDRAAALRALKAQSRDASWEHIAEMIGIKRSRLFQLLDTEKLPEQAQHDIRTGQLNEKQSRALHGLPPVVQEALRVAILQDGLSASQAQRAAAALKEAGVTDDVAAAQQVIAAAIRPQPKKKPSNESAESLLALIAGLDPHDLATQRALASAADHLQLPGVSRRRVRSDVLALAKSLARLEPAEIERHPETRALLHALHDALTALLRS